MTGPQGTFTGVTGTDGPNTADISSFAASFASAFSATAGGSNTATQTSAQASATGTDSNDSTATSSSAPVTSPTTFSTSTTSTAYASSTLPPGVSGTASNAASSTTGAVTVSEKSSCSGLSCHPGLKAAIAVPVVVAALVALFLLFFCIRRRRRKSDGVISEKKPKTPGKGWSRHLRAFSFDAELLMGGRFSGTNSMRSRDPSVRSAGTNSRTGGASVEPSLHSIEEVAPPYRDAISHAQIPTTSIQAAGAAPLAAGAAAAASIPDPIPRPASTATAPPPYRSIAHDVRSEPLTPVSGNPFADSAPVSPIEGSPFNDPPEEDGQRPVLSRNSSLYRSVNTEDGAPSDAGSIREAQVGRRVSVRTSGTPPRSTT